MNPLNRYREFMYLPIREAYPYLRDDAKENYSIIDLMDHYKRLYFEGITLDRTSIYGDIQISTLWMMIHEFRYPQQKDYDLLDLSFPPPTFPRSVIEFSRMYFEKRYLDTVSPLWNYLPVSVYEPYIRLWFDNPQYYTQYYYCDIDAESFKVECLKMLYRVRNYTDEMFIGMNRDARSFKEVYSHLTVAMMNMGFSLLNLEVAH